MSWFVKLLKQFLAWLAAQSPAPEPAPTPAPGPPPTPVPPPAPDPGTPAREVLVNMAMIPDQMHSAGFGPARYTACWFALSRTMYGSWQPGTDPDLLRLDAQRDQIRSWWEARVAALVERMRRNPLLTVTLIIADAPDRCGRSLGLGSLALIPEELRGRVSMGETVAD